MTAVFARKAMLPHGWADDVRLQVVDGNHTARGDVRAAYANAQKQLGASR